MSRVAGGEYPDRRLSKIKNDCLAFQCGKGIVTASLLLPRPPKYFKGYCRAAVLRDEGMRRTTHEPVRESRVFCVSVW